MFELGIEKVGSHELLNGRFRDFDELSTAVAGWDLDFVQLDPGRSPAALAQVSGPGLLVQRFVFGRTYLQRGANPSSMRTFGLVAPAASETRMFGSHMTGSDLAVFRANGEFESVSQPGFSCLAISIDEARLDEAFEAIELPRKDGNRSAGSGLLSVDPKILQGLRCRATQLLDVLKARPDTVGRLELLEELGFQLPIDLARAIQSADAPRRPAASRVRDVAARRAVSIIEDHVDEPITIRKLCQETGVGWTTLVHAFREHFGVTPKAYLRAVRLNCVRRGLLEVAPETRIADVANSSGFWHMGQFAADYKHQFGELPSDTKSRMPAPERTGSGG